MSRKDYEAIAKVISDKVAQWDNGLNPQAIELIADIACGLANILEADNPQFKRAKFLAACQVL